MHGFRNQADQSLECVRLRAHCIFDDIFELRAGVHGNFGKDVYKRQGTRSVDRKYGSIDEWMTLMACANRQYRWLWRRYFADVWNSMIECSVMTTRLTPCLLYTSRCV